MDELIERLIEAAEGFDACRDIENSNLCLNAVEALREAQAREKVLVSRLEYAALWLSVNGMSAEANHVRAAIPSRPSQPSGSEA